MPKIPFAATALALTLSQGLALGLAPDAQAASWQATYELHVAGLRAMEARFIFDIDGPAYRLEMHVRNRGLVGIFASNDQTARVDGRWVGQTPRPVQYRLAGTYRGQRREAAMDYGADGRPTVLALQPNNAADQREEIPPARLAGTLDALSAVAQLSRVVAATNRCDAQVHLFDARRLTQVTVRTEGQEAVPADWGAGTQGQALRCVLESRILAGFRRDQDRSHAQEAVLTTAWIGRPTEGAPPVPLRIELASRWWGRVHATLVRMERAAP